MSIDMSRSFIKAITLSKGGKLQLIMTKQYVIVNQFINF